MIGKWVAKAWVKMAGIKVIHSIPGRLRIHFSGGAKAREFMQKQKDLPGKIYLYKLTGIHSFDFNPLTSRVLIVYDADKLNEKDIMGWLERLQELIIETMMNGEERVSQDIIDGIASQLTKEGYALEKFEQRTTA